MSAEKAKNKGTLFVVATPIGNLQDLTFRALEILKEADLILCEDTRTTRKLLSHYEITGKKLWSLYKDNERKRLPQVLESLSAGARVALVSEAGTPGLSDPGALVVREARKAGFPVVPVPGPSALTAFLSVSGWDLGEGFLFLGFPPSRKAERRRLLEEAKDLRYPLVFFVPPHRLLPFLREALEILGNRPLVLGRELTKVFEEVLCLTLKEALARFENHEPRGEFVLLVAGRSSSAPQISPEEALAEVKSLRAKGLALKEAVREVAVRYGLSRKELYGLAVRKGLA